MCRSPFKLWLSISLFLCLLCSHNADAQALKERLEHAMDSHAAAGFSGTVLVAKKGALLLEKGYGYRNRTDKTPNDAVTIYRAGHLAEPLTAEMIVTLDSKAQLGLDDRISKYLPDFPGGEYISIRQLLAHTAGLPEYVPDLRLQKNNVCRPLDEQTFIEAMQKPAAFAPGTRYGYSNADYMLLGFVIAHIAKIDYEAEMQKKLFSFCDMRHTGFAFAGLGDASKATGYEQQGRDYAEVHPTGDTAIMYAANGLYTTVGDLYRLHQALHQYRLLPKDWQDIAYTPLLGENALGWQVEHMYNKRFMMQDGGGYAGFTSALIRQQEDDVCIIVLENRAQAGYSNMTVARDLMKILYGPEPRKPHEKERKAVNADDGGDPLAKYVGVYLFNESYRMTVKQHGSSLTVETADENPIELEAQGSGVFQTKGAPVTLTFETRDDGKVNTAILRQNGQDYAGKRVR